MYSDMKNDLQALFDEDLDYLQESGSVDDFFSCGTETIEEDDWCDDFEDMDYDFEPQLGAQMNFGSLRDYEHVHYVNGVCGVPVPIKPSIGYATEEVSRDFLSFCGKRFYIRFDESEGFVGDSCNPKKELSLLRRYCDRFNWKMREKDFRKLLVNLKSYPGSWVKVIERKSESFHYRITFLDGRIEEDAYGDLEDGLVLLNEDDTKQFSAGIRLFVEQCCEIRADDLSLVEESRYLMAAYNNFIEDAEYLDVDIKRLVRTIRLGYGLKMYTNGKHRGLKGIKLKPEFRVELDEGKK